MRTNIVTLSLAIFASVVILAGIGLAIDPSKVPKADKAQWCLQQKTTCNSLCVDEKSRTSSNTCNTNDLTWTCSCQNGFIPNATQYTQTIPYYICSTDKLNCEKKCTNNEPCILACRTQFQCTATDPPRSNTTTATPGSGDTSSSSPSTPATYTDSSPILFEIPAYGIIVAGVFTVVAMINL